MAFAALTVDINAKVAKFEDDMARVRKSMGGLEKSAGVLKAGLGGLFAGVGVAGLVAFAKNGIDAADALKDMSDRLGVSVKDLASFKLAAEQSGTELEGVGKGIARLTRSIGEAEGGNAKLAEALKTLGITARDPKEAFFQLADATERIQDPSKRAALLAQVLGKSYQDLIPLLSQGSEELRKSAKASESFSDAMARLAPNADKFNDDLARLKINAAGAAGSILSDLLPALKVLLGVGIGVAEGFQQVGTSIGAAFAAIANPRQAFTIINQLFSDIEKRQAAFKKRFAEITAPASASTAKKTIPGSIDLSAASGKPKSTRAGKAADPQGDFVKKLREEAATLGLSGEALQRYEALKLKLTGSNAKLADSYITQIAAFKAQQEAAAANNEEAAEAIKKQFDLDDALKDSIKSLKEWIAEQEFEVSLIGLSNNERESAIQLRALETAGINTQAESYKQLAEQVAAANSRKRGISILSGTQTEKTKEFMADIAALDALFFDGAIGAQQFSEGIDLITGSTEKASVEVDKFAENAAKNIQQSMADFLFDPFKDGLDGMLLGFGKMLQRMIAEAVAADLAKRLFGGLSDGGKTGGSGWIGGALELFGGLFASANGNAFANGAGLSAYSGSVVSKPTVFPFANGAGLMGEAGPEVILPLKRGSNGKLGVQSGGGGNITVIVNGSNNAPDVRRAAGQGAREALGMFSAAKRYA